MRAMDRLPRRGWLVAGIAGLLLIPLLFLPGVAQAQGGVPGVIDIPCGLPENGKTLQLLRKFVGCRVFLLTILTNGTKGRARYEFDSRNAEAFTERPRQINIVVFLVVVDTGQPVYGFTSRRYQLEFLGRPYLT